MESIQDIYNETISRRTSEEQLELAALILNKLSPGQNKPQGKTERLSMIDLLAQGEGQRLFKTSAEVDAYLREERDSWDR